MVALGREYAWASPPIVRGLSYDQLIMYAIGKSPDEMDPDMVLWVSPDEVAAFRRSKNKEA